ncbi:hypothetical protein JW978_00980 [Candidatus Dojkabacteria bacterium]|nr:hypothetical protein [Candidatus Dojkabacteria bacterium]
MTIYVVENTEERRALAEACPINKEPEYRPTVYPCIPLSKYTGMLGLIRGSSNMESPKQARKLGKSEALRICGECPFNIENPDATPVKVISGYGVRCQGPQVTTTQAMTPNGMKILPFIIPQPTELEEIPDEEIFAPEP